MVKQHQFEIILYTDFLLPSQQCIAPSARKNHLDISSVENLFAQFYNSFIAADIAYSAVKWARVFNG
jgi:hypothetical protein